MVPVTGQFDMTPTVPGVDRNTAECFPRLGGTVVDYSLGFAGADGNSAETVCEATVDIDRGRLAFEFQHLQSQ